MALGGGGSRGYAMRGARNAWYNGVMFVALAVAVTVGVIVALATIADQRLRITDDPRLALLVCVSGAITGWALVDTITGLSADGLDLWDVVGAATGAAALAVTAWRGRRRTFSELGLKAHSE